MKIAVIGGGSTYTPEPVNGFLARRNQFPLDELWQMDLDVKRLAIVGGFAQRLVAAKDSPSKVNRQRTRQLWPCSYASVTWKRTCSG